MRAITKNISDLLHETITPIFNRKCRRTNIVDGAHLIRKLQRYQRKGLFEPLILFCTFDIHNLYTMLTQEEVLNILIEFLYAHGYRQIKGLILDTISKLALAAIVLKENIFVDEKKFYRRILRGTMGSSLTLVLANVFMGKWQKKLVHGYHSTKEFYGR